MAELEDTVEIQTTGIFGNAYDEDDLDSNNHSYADESVGAEADFNNMEPSTFVSPIPTTRVHFNHAKAHIIGDPMSAVQTRGTIKNSSGEHAMISYIQKKKRTNHKDFQNCLFTYFLSQNEPTKITQALNDESWVKAMQEELLQFKIQKKDKRGIVVKNKARMVAQGHTQEEGIDYDEVFASVARVKAIRLFLAFASYMNFPVYRMDVKSAFLYGNIDDEVYVSQPLGFVDPEFPKKVYKVLKALYGLHQAPRTWYETLSTYLLDNGFHRGQIDKTLFIKKLKGDILLVQQKEDGIFINRDKYVGEILKKFGFFSIRSASTPMETHKPLTKDENVKRIFRYLKGQPKLGLWYPKDSPLALEAFSDSGYAGATLDTKSTTTKIHVDDESAICVIKNPVYHSKTKHIEIRHHFIRDSYEKRLIEMVKIHTDNNVADLLTKAFDTSAKVKKVNDEVRIQALVDGERVNIKESSIRRILRLDDAEGTSCLTNTKIFEGLARMGYKKPSDKLTFYKAFFSPQWKFMINSILQCLSAKTTSWNEFSSTMASAIIFLATNQKFNFSRYILLSLVKNIEVGVPFFMFPRFVQLIINHQLGDMTHRKDIFDTSSLTKKVFANMKRVAEHNVSLPSPSHDLLPSGEDSLKLKGLMDLCNNLSNKVLDLESKMLDIKSTYKANIKKLESRVERLEEENMVLKELKGVHSIVESDETIMEKEESSKQERKIADIDVDVEINLEKVQAEAYNLDLDHQEKVLSMLDVNDEEPADVKECSRYSNYAAEATKVTVEVPKLRKRKGVIIQDPEETTTTVTEQPKVQEKDKGKAILIKEPKQFKRQVQILLDEEVNEGIKVPEKEVRQEKEVEVESSNREDDDDDVYTDATPLASKIPILDYKIHTERNRPYFKIIRADGIHKLFMSFSTMMKNFDREDLESL
nr:hypothetical protein [Tanacetum cinerariifolium]